MLQIFLLIIALISVCGYSIYLLTRRPFESSALVLVLGLMTSLLVATFDLLAYQVPQNLFIWRKWGLICEGFLPLIWFYFSTIFYRDTESRQLSMLQRLLLLGSLSFVCVSQLLPLENLYYSPDFAEEKILFLNQSGYLFYVGIMVYLTLAMVNLERTFSALPHLQRWRVKLEIVGAGVIMATSLLYYSQSLLYRSLDLNLLPAHNLGLILAVLLMAYSRFKRGQGSRIAISRKVAFHSVVVLLVGIYLLILGLLGEGMRYVGVPSQKSLFIIVGLFSGVSALILFLSESLRRKFKTLLHRNFYRSKFDYRQQWLTFTEKTSGSHSTGHLALAILALFCETFGLKGASLYWNDEESGDFIQTGIYELGLRVSRFKRDTPIVDHLQEKVGIVLAQDLTDKPFDHVRKQIDADGVSFFIPLLFEGRLEGFIALGAAVDKNEVWGYEDFELMEMLARQGTTSLLNQELSEQLMTSQEMAAIGKVSAFVLHDLKNQVSGLAMLTDNARSFMDNPEFQTDMLETLEGTIGNMRDLIDRLKNLKENRTLEIYSCDLMPIVQRAIHLHKENIFLRGIPVMAQVDESEICKVVLNLVLNALEAGKGQGPVDVEVGCEDLAFIRVSDQGCGMTTEYIRDRLFKPFETTKQKGTGIGLYQARQAVEALGGRIDVESRVGKGSTFTIWLQLSNRDTVGAAL